MVTYSGGSIMKKIYFAATFIFLMIPNFITSSDNEQQITPTGFEINALKALSKSNFLHAELDGEKCLLEYKIKNSLVEYSDPTIQEKLNTLKDLQRLQRLKMVNKKITTIKRKYAAPKLTESEAKALEENERKITIATAIGCSACTLPVASTLFMLTKSQSKKHTIKKNVTEILNGVEESLSLSPVKLGFGIAGGIALAGLTAWGAITLKNKFIEMHRKYNAGKRATTLENKHLRNQISTLQKAILRQNQVLEPMIKSQSAFRQSILTKMETATKSNRQIIDHIKGEGGLLQSIKGSQETFEILKDSIIELDDRLKVIEELDIDDRLKIVEEYVLRKISKKRK